MVIEIYQGFSKKPNSTKQPSGGRNVTVTLKEGCSVLNPIFILNGFNLSDNYIRWGVRYYYVDDIVILHNEVAEYHCSSDVLATYKNTIGSSTQYVLRADSSYDLFIADSKYPTKSRSYVENIEFSTLHSEFVNGGSLVIGVVNGIDTASAGISYYCLTPSEAKDLLEFMFDGTWLDATDVSAELQKELINPFQYIDSITWYPFDIPNSNVPFTPKQIKFGYWDSGVIGGLLNAANASKGFAQQITIPSHRQVARGFYLNGYPYTRLLLECYSFGNIPVDSSYFVGDQNLTLGISVDFLTGMGKLTLRAGSQGELIYKQYAQIGVPMKISQMSQGLVAAGANVVGGAVGLAYGNVVGFAQGVLSGLASMMPQLSSSGTNGSKSAFVTAPTLIVTRQNLVDEDKAQIGRPLCSPMTISSLSGYILCEGADLDVAATPTEKDAILSYMNGGFYYE